MSSWVVVPSMLALRGEFNAVAPGRDKGADGTIGDVAHAAGGNSDHLPDEDFAALRDKDSDRINEVHALDIDSTGPWPDGRAGQAGAWLDTKIKAIIAEEKRRWLDPDDVCRLDYVIWRGKIYSRAYDFRERDHTGPDPHFDHVHFSARYVTAAENDTRPWGVKGDELSAAEVSEIKAAVEAARKSVVAEIAKIDENVWGTKIGGEAVPGRTAKMGASDLANGVRPALMFEPTHPEAKVAGVRPGSPLATLRELPGALSAIVSTLKAVDQRLAAVEAKLDAE